jgi:multisubunit Na+/H+ antiporter MnhB subunit
VSSTSYQPANSRWRPTLPKRQPPSAATRGLGLAGLVIFAVGVAIWVLALTVLASVHWMPRGLQRLALEAGMALSLGAVAVDAIVAWRLTQRLHWAALTEAHGVDD